MPYMYIEFVSKLLKDKYSSIIEGLFIMFYKFDKMFN